MSLFKLKKLVYNLKNTNTNLKSLIYNLNMFIGLIINFIPKRSLNILEDYFLLFLRYNGQFIRAFTYTNFVYSFYIQYTTLIFILNDFMVFKAFLDGFTRLNFLLEINEFYKIIKWFNRRCWTIDSINAV